LTLANQAVARLLAAPKAGWLAGAWWRDENIL